MGAQQSISESGEGVPNSTALPWTLIRPPTWHMRFVDAAAWVRAHPRSLYMNQLMVADLGSRALADLRTPAWVEETGLKLISPSLWLASDVVTTGFHTDGPENLLAQLSGHKEVILADPSEKENLYYQEVADIERRMDVSLNGSVHILDVTSLHRTSHGHSVVDIADPSAIQRFPRYKEVRAINCSVEAGDVLYIPSQWHHAVLTTPDSSCVGLSLNLWYHRTGKLQDQL